MSIGRSKSVAGASASHALASGENGSPQPQTVTLLAGATRRRRNSGLLCELQSMCKRTLRATSQTIVFPFYSKTGTTPTRAQPKPDVVPALKPAPRRMRPPAAPGRKHQRNVDAVVPPAMATSPRAEIRFPLTTADTQRYLRAQWRQAETGGRSDQAAVDRLTTTLTARLLATSAATGNGVHEDSGEKACARAIMVCDALAQATGGDPARAHDALLALLDTTSHADARVRADVLALQTALGVTTIGLDTLLAIAPHVLPQRGLAEGSAAPEIQREALRHALRAADHCCGANRPMHLARPASRRWQRLPIRSCRPSSVAAPAAAQRRPQPRRARHPRGSRILATRWRSRHCMRPMPCAPIRPRNVRRIWRKPIWRGATGSTAKVRARISPKRSSASSSCSRMPNARPGRARPHARRRAFGTQKSPLSALQNFGTAGVMLGHPDDEFARFTAALAPVKTQLADRLKAASTSRALKTRCAVRLAAIEQWERRMASKGLRSTFRFSSRDLETVAVRARPLLSNRVALHADGSPADLALDPHRNRDAIRAEVKPLRGMTPAQLRTWADEAWRLSGQAVPEPIRANIDLVESRLAGDIRPKPGDTNAQLDAIGALVKQMPDIYDIRVSSGGTVGLGGVPSQSLAALSSHLGVPHVSVLPDGGYLQGRHAVIDIGSNQHFGHLFIGTESRKSLYGGLGGYAGWSFGQDGMANVGVSGGLRRSRDWGGPRGVTIRTRRSDDEQPGRPDAWRTTMLEVLHAARSAGPNSDAPRNAREMWGSLARRFWNDPACSINWTNSRSTTSATSGSASATARVGTADTKWGPALGATLRHVARAAHRQWDKTGSHAIDVSTHNSGRATAVAATLVEALPGIPVPNGSGHLAALSFPTQPYVGIGTTLFTTQTNAALRIGRDSGRIIPKHTFRDTEFGTFKAFKQFVDTHRSEWLTALGGTDDARRRLDEMVATVKARATAGNLIMGERMHMTDEAARRLDFLFHRKQRFDRIPAPTPVQARERASIDADIRQMLASENSWRRQALYVLEALGVQRTVGLSFLLNAQSTQAVSGVRELAGLSPE